MAQPKCKLLLEDIIRNNSFSSVKLTHCAPCGCHLDAAGIHFVVNKTDQASSSEHRKARMSHATKSQWKRRKNGPLQSWINPGQSIRHTEMNSELLARNHLVQPMPRLKMVGGDFSATKLPPGIEPAAIQDLVKSKRYPSFIRLALSPSPGN